MDARLLRAARFFLVFLLVGQLSVGPAVGETASSITTKNATINALPVRALKAGGPTVGIGPRAGLPRPIAHPVAAPLPGRALPGITPRKRPNVQGPTTYAGTASLDFTPTTQYLGYSVTAAGTITPAAGYTYELTFGDGNETPIPLTANAASTTYSIAHTYTSAGTNSATILATDANGNATTIVTQPVSTYALTGNVSQVSSTPNTQQTITFTGNVPMTAPPAPAITIDYGDGTPTTASTFAASISLQHAYTTVGNYTIKVTATTTGATIATGTATVAQQRVVTDNGTIVASPAYVYIGSTVTFSGNAPNNPAGASQVVTFGDGDQSAAFGDGGTFSFPHVYSTATNYTASVTQTPPNGATGTTTLESTMVTVDGLSGTISGSGVPGSPATIVFNGVVPASNAPPNPPAITISFGDGTTTTSTYGQSVTLTHTYATAGNYQLLVNSGQYSVTAGIANIAGPLDTVVANPTSIYSGSSDNIMYTYGPNPMASSAPQCVVEYGDGTTQNVGFCATATYTHTYTATTPTTETIRVSPANNAANAATTTLTVDPLGGTIAAPPVMQGSTSSITFTGMVPAANPPTPPMVTLAFGDGQTTTVTYGTATVQHAYAAPGSYTLTASVNGNTIATGTAAVNAAALTVSAAPGSVYSGTSTTFTIMDPAATGPASTCIITFGDGSTQNFTCGTYSVAHTYTVTATTAEPVSVYVVGPNGGPLGSTATTTVNVVVPAASVTLSAPTLFSGATENATIMTNAINGVAGPTMTIDWGDGSTPTSGLPFQNQVVSHGYATTRLGQSNHRYVAPGTYTLRLYDAAGTLATQTVTVVTPSVTATVANPAIITGQTESVAIAVGNVDGLAGPMLSVSFGDGATSVIPYADATLQHAYAAAGNYTINVSDGTGTLATAQVVVAQPSATIGIAPDPVIVGTPTTVSVNVTPLGGATGPAPLTLNFGDGTTTVLPSYTNASYQHTYPAVGTYTATLSAPGFATIGSNIVQVVQQNQALVVPLTPVVANAPADIIVNVTPAMGFGVIPLRLSFGDGTSLIVTGSGTYPHAYPAPGTYTVTLANAMSGLVISTQIVTVLGSTPRVPVGTIYSSSFTNSPVLAGGETFILIQYSLALPSMGTVFDPIEGYVDLLDAKGKLVRRSDDFEIEATDYSGPGVHTTKIPYDTPVDAHGTYQTRIILRSAQGGTISVGPPATLIIIGGPDPAVKVNAQFSDNGSVEIGPHAGQPGATFDAGISAGFILPTYSGAISGLFDPISRKSDPLLTIKSGAAPISAPDATPAPTPPPSSSTAASATSGAATPAAATAPSAASTMAPPAVATAVPPPPSPVPPAVATPAFSNNVASAGSPAPAATVAPASAASAAPATIASAAPATVASAAPIVSTQVAPAATGAATTASVATAAPAASAAATVLPGSPPGQNYAPQATAVPTAPSTGPPSTTSVAQQAFAVPDRAAAYATPSVPVAGPVAATSAPQPASSDNPVPHTYTNLGGRGQLTLPDALGGGSPLRGVDVLDTLGPVAYQVGYGYSSLGTADTSPERASVADLTRTFGGDGSVRVAYFGRQDDPVHYPIMMGATGPLVTDSEALILSAPTVDGFKLAMSGAVSDAHALQSNYQTNDAADKLDLTYAHASYNFAFDYHNAGSLFAVGSGPGASSDRVGFASSSTIPLGSAVQVALNYNKDEARSAFSRQSDAGAAFSFTLPKSSTLALAYKRDTQVAPTANTLNSSETGAIGTHLGIGTIALNASVSNAQDLINAVNSAVTRTASFQFALQSNGHSFGFGVNATDVTAQGAAAPAVMATATPAPTVGDPTSMSAPAGVGSSMVAPVSGAGGNSQIGETITYGFPFGGRVVNGAIVHGLELQLSGSNSAQHSLTAGGYDQMLSSIFSYHLTPHLALGLRGEYDWHGDIVPANRTRSSAIRLRLDLAQ